MKHRRAGPMRIIASKRARPTKTRTKVRKPTKDQASNKAEAAGQGAPRPIGPWLALQALLEPEPKEEPLIIIDAGAHYGNVTALFLRLWPSAKVYCFEPEPEGLKRLRARYDDNPRVEIIPRALGRKQETAKFHICGQGTEMSSLLPRSEWLGRRYYRHEVRETIEVEVDTLDAFIDRKGIEVVHLLKMDLQGGEMGALQGAIDTLKERCYRAIYSEILFVGIYKGASLFWELCRMLDRYAYTVFDVYNLQRSWINRQLKYGDALWIDPVLRSRSNAYPEDWLRKSLEHRMWPNR